MNRPNKHPLTPEEWAALRARWEGAAEPGFTALAAEVLTSWGLVITRQGIADIAKRRGWAKTGQPSEPLVVTRHSTAGTDPRTAGAQVEGQAAQVLAQVPQVRVHEVADEVIEAEEPKAHPGAAKRGRPSKFEPRFADEILAFFDKEPFTTEDVPQPNGMVKRQRMATDPPMLAGFAKSIGVSLDSVNRWATEVTAETGGLLHPDFADAYARARELQESLIVRGGLLGLYDPRVVQTALKNLHGWQDQPARKVAVAQISKDELDRRYGERMLASRMRMQALMEERADILGPQGHEGSD